MLLRVFYFFIELLTVKENVLYVIQCQLMHKKKQIHGIGTDFKESLSFLKQFIYE